MTPDQVIALRPGIYNKVPKTNFVANWRALKKRIETDKDRAVKDDERYEHDTAIYLLAKDLPWEWHGSDAERLLKVNVAKKRHLKYSPSLLYLKRPEYKKCDYEIFRKHIHQEARSALESPYWMVQKEKKEKKNKAIKDAVEDALQAAKLQAAEKAFANLTI